MSRKVFKAFAAVPEMPPADIQPRQRNNTRPLLGTGDISASPVGAVGRTLESATARAAHADEIERKLAEGLTVVELPPDRIDPSFVSDRMESAPEAEESLFEAIREQGQQVPILVRPHPAERGRYQVAYGHRRLRAAIALGKQVRAVVRQLSDEELAVAQGQENNERRDLSYIEKARFAHSLEERFGRKTVMAALSLYKSNLSNMLSVIERIPAPIIEAIGPAPSTGRRGWIELADAVAKKGALAAVEKTVNAEGFAAKSSDDRLALAVAATKEKALAARTKAFVDSQKRQVAKLSANAERLQITIDKRKAPAFAAFVADRLQSLISEFEAGESRS